MDEPIASTSSSAKRQLDAPIHEGVASGLDISLHPLPILNISEHLTRTRLQSDSPSSSDILVFGALLGTQTGREVEIVNSFEIAVQVVRGEEGAVEVEVDHGFFKTRQEQFKQVFPTLDFLGSYSLGSTPTPLHLALNTALLPYSEAPLSLLLDPTPASAHVAKDLPVAIYESLQEIVDNVQRFGWVRCGFRVETGEAERVAVDGVAKPSGTTGGLDNPLVANLTTQRNAIAMLHSRLQLLTTYLDQVASGALQPDHELLRSISALVAGLPATDTQPGGAWRGEYLREYNDTLLTSLLSSHTKSLDNTNQLFDKYLFLASTKEGSGGGGGSVDTRRIGGIGQGGRRH